jgi:hypothetical protein
MIYIGAVGQYECLHANGGLGLKCLKVSNTATDCAKE